MEVGSVINQVHKEPIAQPVSLPSTLKQPLSETPINFEKQIKEERKLDSRLEQPIKISLPLEVQMDVSGYFRNGRVEVYKDSWLTVRRFGSKNDGFVGVYTDNEGFNPGVFSHVTFDVKYGKLVHMQVNSKELFSRMLRNELPKELKKAMKHAESEVKE